jgi:hypothetical protein
MVALRRMLELHLVALAAVALVVLVVLAAAGRVLDPPRVLVMLAAGRPVRR